MPEAVKALSGVASFAFKYECSNFCSSGDMSLLKKIENFNLKFLKF